MKKMTLKEFKQILADSGTDLEFWGYEGILNMISICYDKFARDMKESGLDGKNYKHRANVIYDALHDRGFYDSVENP